jgi:hypothetical protein
MASYSHFILTKGQPYGNELQAAIEEFKAESSSYRSLLADRDFWYSNPPLSAITAIESVLNEQETSLGPFTYPDNSSKGIAICKFCLASISCNPKIFIEDHLALDCKGIPLDVRIQWYHTVKDKNGRPKKDRQTKLNDLKHHIESPFDPRVSDVSSTVSSMVTSATSVDSTIGVVNGSKKRKVQPTMDEYVVKPMPLATVATLDHCLSMFFFTEGTSLSIIQHFITICIYICRITSK